MTIHLRPTTLDEIIGQESVKEQLAIEIAAAKAEGRLLPHVLLAGPPGLGKTTIATVISTSLSVELRSVNGASMNANAIRSLLADLVDWEDEEEMWLMRGNEEKAETQHMVVCIDEIHALKAAALEMLYPVMEEFQMGGFKLAPFTLIAATTDPGKLPMAFRERCQIQISLDFYSDEELFIIAERSYEQITGNEPTESELVFLKEIAKRSHGTPRRVNNLLDRVLSVRYTFNEERITEQVFVKTMSLLEIDTLGLSKRDQQILVTMQELGRPAGLAAIASRIGVETSTIEQIDEPWLVRKGYIERAMRGRQLTDAGLARAYIYRYAPTANLYGLSKRAADELEALNG